MLREVELATSGRVDRHDLCANCGEPMYYHADEAGKVTASLCGNITECGAALLEIPE